MQTFKAHLNEKLEDARFRQRYEEERQLAELAVGQGEADDRSGVEGVGEVLFQGEGIGRSRGVIFEDGGKRILL